MDNPLSSLLSLRSPRSRRWLIRIKHARKHTKCLARDATFTFTHPRTTGFPTRAPALRETVENGAVEQETDDPRVNFPATWAEQPISSSSAQEEENGHEKTQKTKKRGLDTAEVSGTSLYGR
jgi:hypothetical protein